MNKRTIGIVLLLAGLIIIVGGLGAHYIGLSASAAIGTKKLLVAGVGVVVGLVGAYLAMQKK